MASDIYERVTNRIIADLEQGTRPWIRPWGGEHVASRSVRPLRANGVGYRGINVLLLWGEALANGYINPTWMTYRQAQELGGQVRKGERSTVIVYADRFTKTETTDTGEQTERSIPFLKSYPVFNCQQIDGLPPLYNTVIDDTPAEPDPSKLIERIAHAESFVANTGADIRHGGNKAFNTVDGNYVQMPPLQAFRDSESYYATLLHELTHWTRHPKRLDRDFGRKRWGDSGYAAEELTAEIGSAFLCADLGLSLEPRADHASYIESWLKVLRNDKRAIFSAAGYAEAAAGYLHSLQTVTLSEAA
jgi:antirestriction protein ArdC